jgi:hypothetical protein
MGKPDPCRSTTLGHVATDTSCSLVEWQRHQADGQHRPDAHGPDHRVNRNDSSHILGLESPDPVSGANLEALARRSRQNVDLMVKQLTLRTDRCRRYPARGLNCRPLEPDLHLTDRSFWNAAGSRVACVEPARAIGRLQNRGRVAARRYVPVLVSGSGWSPRVSSGASDVS